MGSHNDDLSIARVYQAHVLDVARWAERLAGPGFDLPDLVSEVFEIAHRRLPTFRGDSSLTTWLFGITAKVVRHRRRTDRLRQWLSGSLHETACEVPEPTPSQHERLEEKERAASVYRVLDRLPERDRKILILSELEELSGEQIAGLLGIKITNVWLRIHRARARFLKVFRATEAEMDQPDASLTRSRPGRYGHAG